MKLFSNITLNIASISIVLIAFSCIGIGVGALIGFLIGVVDLIMGGDIQKVFDMGLVLIMIFGISGFTLGSIFNIYLMLR